MWVPFHTDKKQPDELGAPIIPRADGDIEAREVAGDNIARVTLRRQVPWGLIWTLPFPSLSHLAALSLCRGADDPELPDLLLSGEVLGVRLAV